MRMGSRGHLCERMLENARTRRGRRSADGDDEEASGGADLVPAPSALLKLAPAEVDFLLTGKTPAGAALMKEETDEAFEHYARQVATLAPRRPGGGRPSRDAHAASSSSLGETPLT